MYVNLDVNDKIRLKFPVLHELNLIFDGEVLL
jgi:hypothetical protein